MKIKIRIDKKLLGLYLFVLIFLPPQSLYSINGMETITSGLAVLRYISSFIAIIYMLFHTKYRNFILKPYILTFFLAIIFQVIALKQNGSLYMTAGLSCFTYIGFMAANIIFYDKVAKKLLQAYRDILFMCIMFHFITLFIFPNGLIPGLTENARVFFMGNKNVITTYVILAFLSAYLLLNPDFNKKKDRRKILKLALFFTIIAFVNASATNIASLVIIDMFIVITYLTVKNKNMERLTQRLFIFFAVILIIVFFYIVIVMGKGNSAFMSGLTAIVGREMTFSGRRAIWTAAISYIIRFPVWGMGLYVQYNVWGNNIFVYSAHNMFLDYAVKYGCISLTFMILSLVIMIYVAVKGKKNETVRFALVSGLALLFASMFEAMEGFYATWAITLFVYLTSITNTDTI